MKISQLTGALISVAALSTLAGCATYQDELQRGQRAYEQNAHERALSIFRAGESDIGHLTPEERTRYAYLRGMTDFRVGYRADARHWLALAFAWENATPSALPKSWKTRLGETLTELNEVVYKDGAPALYAPKVAAAKSDTNSDSNTDVKAEETDGDLPTEAKPKKRAKPATNAASPKRGTDKPKPSDADAEE